MCATNHLTVLELDNCPLITDASLDHLMSCSSLERIELYDCQLITRAGIRRLKVRQRVRAWVRVRVRASVRARVKWMVNWFGWWFWGVICFFGQRGGEPGFRGL